MHRHQLYDGRPVHINFTLVRGEAEDLPPEWDYEFMPCLVDKKRHLKEQQLKVRATPATSLESSPTNRPRTRVDCGKVLESFY